MNCTKCGAPLEMDAKFCNVCGSPVEAAPDTYNPGGYTPGGQSGYTPGSPSGYTPAGQGGYVPGGQSGYTPGGQGGYVPGGQSGRGAMLSDTKVIRKYFMGNRKWPWILVIAGIPLIAFMGLGLILIIVGIVLLLRESYAGEESVDQAWNKQVGILRTRGMEKLNMIQEQTSLIDPIVLIGWGESPDGTFEAAKMESKNRRSGFSLFGWIGALASLFRKEDGTEYDPQEIYKIGSDERLRSMLLEVSMFVFTDSQVLMYRGDVDISTGLVYRESTSECFYKEIEAINFVESLYKVFNRKKKKYVNKRRESFILYMGGCNFSASLCSGIEEDSVLDNQFTAMRNLIRDKKNA